MVHLSGLSWGAAMPKITAKEVEARKEPGRLACGDNLYLEVDAR